MPLSFFQRKISVIKGDFDRLAAKARARAFTVAGLTDVQAVEFIRAEVERAIREGSTFEQFRQRVSASWDRFGITPIKDHHLRTIFNNNVGQAYSAGRWHQMHDPDIADDFPFFQYHSVRLPTSRPNHVAMHGLIRHRNDPVWDIWWPLNGHNCKCSVTAISRAEIELSGIQETPVPNVRPDPGWEGNIPKQMWSAEAE